MSYGEAIGYVASVPRSTHLIIIDLYHLQEESQRTNMRQSEQRMSVMNFFFFVGVSGLVVFFVFSESADN